MNWLSTRPALSPQATQALEEALAFHGITRTTLMSELIHPLDSIAVQDPDLHRFLTTDPWSIYTREYIERWDFVFSTGMTTDYPVRRKWNDWLAFREIVQNALDIEDRTFGYENILLNISADQIGVHVINRGPPMPRESWKLGGSDKLCHERGRYGEGLKVAAAQFARTDPGVVAERKGRRSVLLYVFTGREAYKAVVPPESNLVLIVWGRTRYRQEGTHVLIYDCAIPPEVVQSMVFQNYVQAYNPPIIQRTDLSIEGCPVVRPNFIIDKPDMLWVADIYVNMVSEITGKPSLFSYNLWYVDLEPNRVAVASIPTLNRVVARIYGAASTRVLLNRLLEHYSATKSFPDCYEVHGVDWWSAPREATQTVVEEMRARNLQWTDQAEAADWFNYMGVAPIIVKESNMQPLFRLADRAEEKVAEISRGRTEEAKKSILTRSDLNLVEAGNLRSLELLYERLDLRLGEPFTVRVVGAMGNAAGLAGVEEFPNTALIKRAQLMWTRETYETGLEEYAHLHGDKTYGAARDVSRAFENSLREVSAWAVWEISHFPEFAGAVSRASKGMWNAQIKDLMYEFPAHHREILLSQEIEVNKNPPLFIGIDEYEVPVPGPYITRWGTDTLSSIRATPEDWQRFWNLTVKPLLEEAIRTYKLELGRVYVYNLPKDGYEEYEVP